MASAVSLGPAVCRAKPWMAAMRSAKGPASQSAVVGRCRAGVLITAHRALAHAASAASTCTQRAWLQAQQALRHMGHSRAGAMVDFHRGSGQDFSSSPQPTQRGIM